MLKHDYIVELYDLYSNLLTEKQRLYFEAYYFEDLSLAEVASSFNLSRNAIFDQIKHVEEKLNDYEEKLHFRAKSEKITKLLANTEYLDAIVDILKE